MLHFVGDELVYLFALLFCVDGEHTAIGGAKGQHSGRRQVSSKLCNILVFVIEQCMKGTSTLPVFI